MWLSQLLEGISVGSPWEEQEISGVTADSSKVRPGGIFVCVRGERCDGHDFAPDALKNGAALVVTERDLGKVPQLLVEDSRKAYGLLCRNFYHHPEEKLHLFGITGTNGKTTTAHILTHLLEYAGETVGMTGTVCHRIAGRQIPSHYTTPTPEELYALLDEMVQAGCTCCVSEASSQALAQERMLGLRFFCGIYTNLTEDHLDVHRDMEQYYQAKKKLFSMTPRAVVSLKDDWGRRLAKEIPCETVTFSRTEGDYRLTGETPTSEGTSFFLEGKEETIGFISPFPGQYNSENAAGALLAAHQFGVSMKTLQRGLAKVPPVRGRLEKIPTGREFSMYLDYAHTPDGLEKALTALRQLQPGRLVCLFGCGGDRDRQKRPQMGQIAAALSDFVVLTSDNPRSEAPRAILQDILAGLRETDTPYAVIENRETAIAFTIQSAQKGDVILLAGKGHETYQVLQVGKIPFDERKITAEWLSRADQLRPTNGGYGNGTMELERNRLNSGCTL